MSDAEDLASLPTIDRADVYKAGALAATLTRTVDGVEFRYLDAWLADYRAPVASTLPPTAAPLLRPSGALPSFFTGLLPEGRRLGALRRAMKTSADDELSLLLGVGADAIGDVQVVPEGVEPAAIPPHVVLGSEEPLDFGALLDDLGIRPQRQALPGVQDKTSVAMINVPVARAGDRFILKLTPPEYPHLVENEAFFLTAARRSGLTVPHHELIEDARGRAGLLVRRFDRCTVDGNGRSLAVEDGCQAGDRPPADKYRLGAEATFRSLVALCDAPVVAARTLVRQLAFAYLTGNGDAHAKNFSVLQSLDSEWAVSPAYDVPNSTIYGDATMALSQPKAGGELGGGDFVTLAASLDVPPAATRTLLTDLTDRVDLWLEDIATLPFDRSARAKLRRTIERRRERLRTGLTS